MITFAIDLPTLGSPPLHLKTVPEMVVGRRLVTKYFKSIFDK